MAYQLEPHESIPNGIRRIVQEEIDRALAELTGSTAHPQDEAVHEARKGFKKLRAILRLVRQELGPTVYKQENICIRDAGRHLSDVRDAQVRIETLERWIQPVAQGSYLDTLAIIRQDLEEAYEAVCQQVIQDKDAIPEVIAALKAARERVSDWPLHRDDWSVLKRGVKQIYQQGQQQMQLAQRQPTVANLHEWRKRVKDLWYHLIILTPIWPPVMQAWAEELHHLSDRLGEDHDLAVFHQFILDRAKYLDREAAADLMQLINDQRVNLQSESYQLGQRLYAESGKAFAARLKCYWKIGRSP